MFAQMWYINNVTLPGSLAVSSLEESFKIAQNTTLRQRPAIGLLDDDVILLPQPESFRVFFLPQIRAVFI